jgi:NAD(P)-dependent dehydrogenase (short-subunit alcohol dehydrogenase family)
VVVTGRDQVRGDAVVAEIAANGGTGVFLPADLGDERAITQLVNDAADRMNGLTVLVNNAAGGDAPDGAVADLTNEAWDAILRVDLTAPMWCARAAIPHMQRAGHGSIVNMSSRQAERASRGLAAYIAAKAGLNGLTRAIAVDYANDGIRANTISPGYVLNDRRDADITPERRARYEGMHLTRLGAASDVAHAAVYLASRESEFVTGINLQLDGGSSAARGLTLG